MCVCICMCVCDSVCICVCVFSELQPTQSHIHLLVCMFSELFGMGEPVVAPSLGEDFVSSSQPSLVASSPLCGAEAPGFSQPT